MGRYDKYKDINEAKKVRDEEIKRNQDAWREAKARGDEAGMAASHEAQKAHIAEFDAYLGGKSSYNPEKGTWSLSDGERTESGGVTGNSFLNRYFNRSSSRGAKEFDDAYEKYRANSFAFDPANDPDYEVYKREYKKAGLEAMDDALARSAARTGGVASSYAVTAGAMAYNDYMSRLAEKIPELKKLAYEKYSDEQERYLESMALARQMMEDEEAEYDKNREAYSEYQNAEKEKSSDYSLAMAKAQTGGFSSLSDSDIRALYESGCYYDPETNRIKSSDGTEFALPEETEDEETAVSAALLKFRYKGNGMTGLSDSDIETLINAGYTFDGTNWISPEGEATAPVIKTAAKKASSSKSSKSTKSGNKSTNSAIKTAKSAARELSKKKVIKKVTPKNKNSWFKNKKIDPTNYTPGKAFL